MQIRRARFPQIRKREILTSRSLVWHSSFSIYLHCHHLAGIEKAGHAGHGIGHTAGDDETVLVESPRVLGEKSLVGGIDTAPQDPPLPAMGVTRYGEVDGVGTKVAVVVFGVMGHEQLVALGSHIGIQPVQLGLPAGVEQTRAQTADGT